MTAAGFAGQFRQIDRRMDGPQVEDRRPAWDQYEIGRAGGGQAVLSECGAVSMMARSAPASLAAVNTWPRRAG